MKDQNCSSSARRSQRLAAACSAPASAPDEEKLTSSKQPKCWNTDLMIRQTEIKMMWIDFNAYPLDKRRDHIEETLWVLNAYITRGTSTSSWTNLTNTGFLLGAGCHTGLELLLNPRHQGAGPDTHTDGALCKGRAGLEYRNLKTLHSLMEFPNT